MVQGLNSRVRSERGASLSFALFVFLVCAMASAAVLAAATAASGQYVNLGEADQRYYAVISAANLLRGNMAEGEEATYQVLEKRAGTVDVARSSVSSGGTDASGALAEALPEDASHPITFESIEPNGSDPDFLGDVTKYALYGPSMPTSGQTTGCISWDELKPFDAGDSTTGNWWKSMLSSTNKDHAEGTLTIAPSMEGALTTVAHVRLYDNWLVEVVISNETDAADERFSLYMAYQGTCKQDMPSISSKMGDTAVSGSSLLNQIEVEETRTTTVTWQLVRIMPGRGFTNE